MIMMMMMMTGERKESATIRAEREVKAERVKDKTGEGGESDEKEKKDGGGKDGDEGFKGKGKGSRRGSALANEGRPACGNPAGIVQRKDGMDQKGAKRAGCLRTDSAKEQSSSSGPSSLRYFDAENPAIKREILTMITQYLEETGYTSSAIVIQDEANMDSGKRRDLVVLIKRIQLRIQSGDWIEVEKLYSELEKLGSKLRLRSTLGRFRYEIYKQQFLEHIHRQEFSKAFLFLKKKLKPLQSLSLNVSEFHDLCYLLTCSQVNEAESFRNWDGINPSRERLAEKFENFIQVNQLVYHGKVSGEVPQGRLVQLLQQAVGYQVSCSNHVLGNARPMTLVKDYVCFGPPTRAHRVYKGHTQDVKSVVFVGADGKRLASGSADKLVRIWDTNSGLCERVLRGHTSKIWCVTSDRKGSRVLSGGGNGDVIIWHMENKESTVTHRFNQRAVYCLDVNRFSPQYVSGGYDTVVRVVDLAGSKVVNVLKEHSALVSSVSFNQTGSMIVSGSRDCSIKFWDTISGKCTRTIDANLGEISSVVIDDDGMHVLSSSKDNCLRLWDVRKGRCLQKFTGFQNTWKHFIRCCFGPDQMVISGSEDGCIYMWDRNSGKMIKKVSAHRDIIYSVTWNSSAALLASCSHDAIVKTWACGMGGNDNE